MVWEKIKQAKEDGGEKDGEEINRVFGGTLSERGSRRRQDTEQEGFQVEGMADAQTQRHKCLLE